MAWPSYTVERKQGHSGSKKIREVCTVCNNGWIGDLDNHAKLIAKELIVGKPLRVTADSQRTLATWLAKISMVGDHIERQRSKISQEHRSYLRENIVPPPTWQIWVSSYGGFRWHHLRMEQFRSALELPNRPKTYFVSNVIGMGTMLALVLGHGALGLKAEIGEPADRLQRVWPTSGTFEWPTDRDLIDEEADELTTISKKVRLIAS